MPVIVDGDRALVPLSVGSQSIYAMVDTGCSDMSVTESPPGLLPANGEATETVGGRRHPRRRVDQKVRRIIIHTVIIGGHGLTMSRRRPGRGHHAAWLPSAEPGVGTRSTPPNPRLSSTEQEDRNAGRLLGSHASARKASVQGCAGGNSPAAAPGSARRETALRPKHPACLAPCFRRNSAACIYPKPAGTARVLAGETLLA